jgi:uncharacterized protein YbaR (Trm112 family)
MEIICQNCKKKLNVPDEKLPLGKTVSFSCPACKEKITVTREENSAPPLPPLEQLVSADEDVKTETFSPDSDEPGAMVCHTDPGPLKALAEKMGYQVHTPKTHAEANKNLRFNQYDLIIITADFEKELYDGSSILQTLQNATMDIRRKTFVLYISPDVKTLNGMQAFALSVNMVLSSDDYARQGDGVEHLLKPAVLEHELNYKIFFETMVELGKI